MARGTRKLVVELVGDSRSLEKALAKSAKATQKFAQNVGGTGFAQQLNTQAAAVRQITAAEQELVKVRARKASSIGPFRLAGVGLGAGLGLYAATQAVRELSGALEETGEEALTTQGRLKNMGSALLSGNIVGAVQAWTRQAKNLKEAGIDIQGVYKAQAEALRDIAAGTSLGRVPPGRFAAGSEEYRKYLEVVKAAGTADREMAQLYVDTVDGIEKQTAATRALKEWTDRLGKTMVTQTGAVVTFKGAVDDLVRAGRGEPVSGGPPSPPEVLPPLKLPPLSPSQRRELELIGKEGAARLAPLQDRLRQLNNQMKAGNVDQEQRLKTLTNIANTEAEIAAIYKDQAAARKAAAEEARREAEAAKAKRDALAEQIKSALLERLQRKQTDVLNKRALADAQERLRIARYLGGPKGMEAARRGLQDVRFDIERARLERAPATLTKGGRFGLGNVIHFHINGITDPEAVARKVAAVMQKRDRHTGSQSRGPAAGTAAGAH